MSAKSVVLTVSCLLYAVVMSAQKPGQPSWLDNAVFYQIYPSSFQDSDGNGIGDLNGIKSRLDYIKSLGVTAIWLNPIYVSGWTDGGYDIIDYYKVDERFGTNTDFVKLVQEAHNLGIKVVMDLVAGHSSDQCEWFIESSQAPDQRYSDYYIWPTFKPEATDSQHAALIRKFVSTDAPRAPFYVKNFYDTQPALNFGYANPDPAHPWEQPVDAPGPKAMRRELKNIMSFWMDKGADGFRVDMAASLVKNDFDKAETIKLWKEDLCRWFDDEYPEGVLIAEWFNPSQSLEAGFDIDFFCHDGMYNYSTLFFFSSMRPGTPQPQPYFSRKGEGSLETWLDLYCYQRDITAGKGYVCMPTGNHDFNRLCTEGRTNPEDLKVAMTFFLTMPGVPFIYYGDEIGLKQNPAAPSTDGSGFRAGCRIPMLWNSSANAGFSSAPEDKIYIPQDPDPSRMTVDKSESDPASLLNYVRGLIELRSRVKVLGADAAWKLLSDPHQPYPMVYERSMPGQRCIVILNPSGKRRTVTLASQGGTPHRIGGNAASYTYRQKRQGDIITIPAASALILEY